MKLTRVIHPETKMLYGPLSVLAPDVVATEDSGAPVQNALAFVDDDSECHIFLVSDAGATRLREMLSPVARVGGPPAPGSIVLPAGFPFRDPEMNGGGAE